MIVRITLSKHRSTWYYTAHNEVGGSFSSNHCGSKKVALKSAALGAKPGQSFELITNERSEGQFTVNDAGQVVKAA